MRSISLKDCRRHFINILAGHVDKVNCTLPRVARRWRRCVTTKKTNLRTGTPSSIVHVCYTPARLNRTQQRLLARRLKP